MLNALVVPLIIVLTAMAPPPATERADPERREGRGVSDWDLGRDVSVVVNPWNDAGVSPCSVRDCGGSLRMDAAAGTAEFRLDMVEELLMQPPQYTLPRTQVSCTPGALAQPADPRSTDEWRPGWLQLRVSGAWTPAEGGSPAAIPGRLTGQGLAVLGDSSHEVELALTVREVSEDPGQRRFEVLGEALPLRGAGDPERPWLITLRGAFSLQD